MTSGTVPEPVRCNDTMNLTQTRASYQTQADVDHGILVHTNRRNRGKRLVPETRVEASLPLDVLTELMQC